MYRPTQLKKIWLRDLTRARVRKISRAKSAVIHLVESLLVTISLRFVHLFWNTGTCS